MRTQRSTTRGGARPSRRFVWQAALAGACAPSLAAQELLAGDDADAGQWLPLRDDKGAPIQNLRVPSELDPFALPGLLWFGPASPDVSLIEFMDYNCPVCRIAHRELDALVRETSELRLGIAHNPILAPGSTGAARIVLGVLRVSGPRTAYDLHGRLMALRGMVDEPRALAQAQELGVKTEALNAPDVRADVERALAAHIARAKAIGFSITPAYVLQGVALFGHPGPKSLARMIAAAKECDALICK
jgi:protein-disulfide isomerase